jgi:hypothetical protein
MVDSRILIFVVSLWKLPSWVALLIAFGVRFDDGYVYNIRQPLQVSNQIYAVRKGAEKACIRVNKDLLDPTRQTPTDQCTGDIDQLPEEILRLLLSPHAIHRLCPSRV